MIKEIEYTVHESPRHNGGDFRVRTSNLYVIAKIWRYMSDHCGGIKKGYVKSLRMTIHNFKWEQRSFCHVCNLPTDGKKCYYKRCPVEPDKTEQR